MNTDMRKFKSSQKDKSSRPVSWFLKNLWKT